MYPKTNKFQECKVFKVKIEYYIDPLSDIKYVMSFCSTQGFDEWVNKRENVNKVVTQMLLRYEYPEK